MDPNLWLNNYGMFKSFAKQRMVRAQYNLLIFGTIPVYVN